MGIFQNHLMGAAAAAASAGATGFYSYQIANSIRGSAAADTTLKFTAGTPTSTTKMTMSFGLKDILQILQMQEQIMFLQLVLVEVIIFTLLIMLH